VLKKDINFYGTVAKDNERKNLWENEYLSSTKNHKFYHYGQNIKREELRKRDLEGRHRSELRQL